MARLYTDAALLCSLIGPGSTSSSGIDSPDFTVATMPARFAEVGERHAAIDEASHTLEPLLEMWQRDEEGGLEDMPYPPDYPKMPGEPKRVQPSRDTDRKK